ARLKAMVKEVEGTALEMSDALFEAATVLEEQIRKEIPQSLATLSARLDEVIFDAEAWCGLAEYYGDKVKPKLWANVLREAKACRKNLDSGIVSSKAVACFRKAAWFAYRVRQEPSGSRLDTLSWGLERLSQERSEVAGRVQHGAATPMA